VPSCQSRRFFRSRHLASTNRSAVRSGSEHSLAPRDKRVSSVTLQSPFYPAYSITSHPSTGLVLVRPCGLVLPRVIRLHWDEAAKQLTYVETDTGKVLDSWIMVVTGHCDAIRKDTKQHRLWDSSERERCGFFVAVFQ
jgi:hypothetical protein